MERQTQPNTSGIYKIQSIIKPERIYIGSARCFRSRQNKHFLDLKKQKHYNHKLQRHYNKYGDADLIFIPFIFCDPKDLIKIEQYLVDIMNPYFNECKVVNSRLGTKVSDGSKLKMRLAKLGKHNPNASHFRKGQVGTRLGQYQNQETRKKISETLKKIYTQEMKDHLSKINVGKKLSKETRERMSKAQKERYRIKYISQYLDLD